MNLLTNWQIQIHITHVNKLAGYELVDTIALWTLIQSMQSGIIHFDENEDQKLSVMFTKTWKGMSYYASIIK